MTDIALSCKMWIKQNTSSTVKLPNSICSKARHSRYRISFLLNFTNQQSKAKQKQKKKKVKKVKKGEKPYKWVKFYTGDTFLISISSTRKVLSKAIKLIYLQKTSLSQSPIPRTYFKTIEPATGSSGLDFLSSGTRSVWILRAMRRSEYFWNGLF